MKKKKPFLVGLTGSIGTGKSTASSMFAALGVPVFCADRTVHRLLADDASVRKKIGKMFPEIVVRGKIDRKKLAEIVFGSPARLHEIEQAIHPLVERERKLFLKNESKRGAKALVFDIPLLFETGAEKNYDFVLCLTAPEKIQKGRVMRRKGMTQERWKSIRKRQMPELEKRKRADLLLRSDRGKADMRRKIKALWSLWQKEIFDA